MLGVKQHIEQEYFKIPDVTILTDHTLDVDFLPPFGGGGRVNVVINEMGIEMKIDRLDPGDRLAYVDFIVRSIDVYILLWDFPGGPEEAFDGVLESYTSKYQRELYRRVNGEP